MSEERTPPPGGEPGTLTSLVDEVFRGAGDEVRSAWVEGLAPGTAVGRYDLIRELGRGGFGVVWEARDRELGRRVAVKVIRVARTGVPEKRLVAEAEVAARLSHPNVVTILDVGRNEKGAWLVQELLTGRTLAARLDEGALPLREALRVGLAVARGLAHAHTHGVVHRDLTPRNVFLCDDGQVKLLDLGMAQAFGRRKLEGGTRDFMAPEQHAGAPEDERVDVYSLGVMMHRMIAGQMPYPPGAAPEARLPAHLETPEAPALGDLVGRMLAADPMDRPRDAAAVLAELESVEAALPRTATGSTAGGVRVRRRWPRWAFAVVVLAAVGAAALLGVAAGRRGTGPPQVLSKVASFSARSETSACAWRTRGWTELDRPPPGAITRHGEIGDQGLREVAGRVAWLQWSDWNAVYLPAGAVADADVFAVEVEFRYPPLAGWQRSANLGVFTDPPAESARQGTSLHGIGFGILEEPGRAPTFALERYDGEYIRIHHGTLPASLAGAWHLIRIEGSRKDGWLRALLDGQPLAILVGPVDLSGKYFRLASGYGYTKPEDVAWSNLRTFDGTPECR